MSLGQTAQVVVVLGALALLADAVGARAFQPQHLLAMLLFGVLVWLAVAANRLVPWAPAVAIAYIAIVLLTAPFSPVQGAILGLTHGMNPIAFATPVLAYVGLSLGRQLKILRAGGWKLVLVALSVITASFLCAAIIAELAM